MRRLNELFIRAAKITAVLCIGTTALAATPGLGQVSGNNFLNPDEPIYCNGFERPGDPDNSMDSYYYHDLGQPIDKMGKYLPGLIPGQSSYGSENFSVLFCSDGRAIFEYGGFSIPSQYYELTQVTPTSYKPMYPQGNYISSFVYPYLDELEVITGKYGASSDNFKAHFVIHFNGVDYQTPLDNTPAGG